MIGGPIESVNIRGRLFAVAADADGARKLGGFENELQMNGNGTGRLIKTRTGWAVSGLALAIEDNRGDQEFLQESINLKDFFPVSVTFVSGHTYQGSGQVVEESPMSTQNVTASVSLMGPGELTQQ